MARKRSDLLAALVQEMPWYVSSAMRFQFAVADQLGMPVTDIHAIGALLEIGPAGVRRLADLMGMTTGAVTRLVDRLERDGFVRREPDPADRRRIVVHVVPERIEAITQYYESMGRRWQEQVAGYSDGELEFLVDFLRTGRAYAKTETLALREKGRRHATRRRTSS